MVSTLLDGAFAYALLARMHGLFGFLGLALLLHPVVGLGRPGRPTRGARWAAGLAAALISGPVLIGWLLYPTYRQAVKPGLLRDALPVALAFETKEHLGAMCLALALGGAAVLFAAGAGPVGRRAARALFAAAFACGLGAGALGIGVAAVAHPGWARISAGPTTNR